jgi:hypothetical protein
MFVVLIAPATATISLLSVDPVSAEGNVAVAQPPWVGTAKFKLENLYKVSLEKNLQLNAGSKLVVKFYKCDNTFQAENVVENWSTLPHQVKDNENVPHPQGKPVEIATLVLTTDNTANEISKITFTVHQCHHRGRYVEILIAWSGCPSCQPAFRDEIIDILIQWSSAPP